MPRGWAGSKVDGNQEPIVKALRRLGVKVHSLAALGGGLPDLLVGWRGVLMLFEVKDPGKQPSARKLTEKEQEFFDEWRGYPVYVIESVDHVLDILRVIDEQALERLRRAAL